MARPVSRTLEFEGRLIAAARALAGLTVKELAAEAGVTTRTINRIELTPLNRISPKLRHGHVAQETVDKIHSALSHRGVALLGEVDEFGAGVLYLKPRTRRLAI